MKKVLIIGIIIIILSAGGIYLKHKDNKQHFKEMISMIDLNDLEGRFIIIESYEENISYRIDEQRLRVELAIYLSAIEKNLNYDFLYEKESSTLTITYSLGKNKISKEYHLKLNS